MPAVCAQELEIARVMHHLRSITDTLQKYVLLAWLKDSDTELFYAVAAAHVTEIMPLVYTPVVSAHCCLPVTVMGV